MTAMGTKKRTLIQKTILVKKVTPWIVTLKVTCFKKLVLMMRIRIAIIVGKWMMILMMVVTWKILKQRGIMQCIIRRR